MWKKAFFIPPLLFGQIYTQYTHLYIFIFSIFILLENVNVVITQLCKAVQEDEILDLAA